MSKACKQQPRKGQQGKPKQLKATAEFHASRGAYETTGFLSAKKKSDERLRKLFKCTTLDDAEIEPEPREEDSTEYGNTKTDWPTESPNMLAATNHDSPTSDV
jgi:hypothetical protein